MIIEKSVMLWLLEYAVIVIGCLSIAIIGMMPVYLLFKYKSLSAIAYWSCATKKEILVMNAGYIGFLTAIVLAIISAILGN